MGKKKGNKKKDVDEEVVAPKVEPPKKKNTAAFAVADSSDDSSDEAPSPAPVKKQPAGKKKDTSSFAALDSDSESDSESEEEAPAPAPKGKGKGKKDTSAFAALAGSEEEESDEESEEEVPVPAKKGKGGKKDTSAFLALADDSESEESEEDEKPAKKGGKKDTSAFLALADDSESESEEEEKPAPPPPPVSKGKKNNNKNKGKKGKNDDADDDDDAILAAAVAANQTEAKPEPAKGKGKKGKKGKGKPVEEEDDDDAFLAAAMAANQPTAEQIKAEEDAKKAEEEAAAAAAAAAEGGEGEEGEEGTGGGKKKRRGGKKKADKKDEKKTAGSAVAEKIKAQREAEEKIRAEAAAKQAAIEEEQRRIEEEEARKLAEKEAKKKAKADKKAADKAAGLLLSKKDKEKLAKQQQRAEMLKKMGVVPSDTPAAPAAEEGGKKKKVVYEKKKKKNNNNNNQDNATEAAAPEPEAEELPKVEELKIEEEEEEEALDAWDAEEVDWENTTETAEEKKKKEKEREKAAAEAALQAEADAKAAKKEASEARKRRQEEDEAAASKDNLRSPIVCIMGHVDTGKTKILDKIRRTNVQDNEAGGITQQIGATYIPAENLTKATARLREKHEKMQIKVPGLLVIDTPGHESFTNLRSRGSSLCDIAILVVDITHGLEPQTLESLRMIREKNCPFIVALNKIDRIFGWVEDPGAPFQTTLASQNEAAQQEFEQRLKETITAFNEEGLNAEVYYKNRDFKEFISLVPTSAHTGEGIPDMLALITQLCQKTISDRIMYRSEIQATVLEVKVVEGHGTTIDIILINGELSVGDQIVVCGLNGPIVANIRALLTPQPMKEIRVKGTYITHKKIRGAMGIKIAAPGLDGAVAGGSMLVPKEGDDLEELQEEVMEDLQNILDNDNKADSGVYVQASTLGSLEALLNFLNDSNIPYANMNIGPVHKKDVMKCSTQVEKNKDYACILAFDVKITPEAQEQADELGVTIYWAEIIYHLFDQFTLRMRMIQDERREAAKDIAVFPCALKIYEQHIFNSRNPILVGVHVTEGQVRLGTPLCIPSADSIMIGKVTSIEHDHKQVTISKKGEDCAIKIEQVVGGQEFYYGRHFDHNDALVSKLTRESIDLLKANFKDEMEADDWKLVKKLKPVFGIA